MADPRPNANHAPSIGSVEEKLLRAIFAEQDRKSDPTAELPPLEEDETLLLAMDLISERIEANAERWDAMLSAIEADLKTLQAAE